MLSESEFLTLMSEGLTKARNAGRAKLPELIDEVERALERERNSITTWLRVDGRPPSPDIFRRLVIYEQSIALLNLIAQHEAAIGRVIKQATGKKDA